MRNVQAQRGEACDAARPRLASIDPGLAAWFEGLGAAPAGVLAPSESAVRAYLVETLELTLDLLNTASPDDASLYFFRLALMHEDRCAEALAVQAQAAGIDGGPWLPVPGRADAAPLQLPAQVVRVGSAAGGLVPANERWAHEIQVPELEIDAQIVNWGRYAEFVHDGGYDEERWWSTEGWRWAQAQRRRAPRYVEQMRQGVVLEQRGRLVRASANRPAMHVTCHEARAWCEWAGRRLPTEAEWELAASVVGRSGFAWGDALEWVAGNARGWPGHQPLPGDLDPIPSQPAAVLRGSCWMSHPRLAHPKARRFSAPDADAAFCGFRSCAR